MNNKAIYIIGRDEKGCIFAEMEQTYIQIADIIRVMGVMTATIEDLKKRLIEEGIAEILIDPLIKKAISRMEGKI